MLRTNSKAIGPLGPEKKIFKGILPYMGVEAILSMWPRCGEQTFVPPAHESSIRNLALIGPVVSKEKPFEDCRRTDGGACL